MLKKMIRALLGGAARFEQPSGRFVGRARTHDAYNPMAFGFRMGTGQPGTVNRSHPSSVEPAQMDLDSPVLGYGLAVVASAANPNTIRQIAAGDGALTKIYGVSVRPYPVQQATGGYNAPFGSVAPPTQQPLDVLTSGYILVPVYGTPAKGGAVYVWIAATTGDGIPGTDHIQGGFEAQADGGNTIALADTIGNVEFNGPPGPDGIGEIRFRI